MKKEMGVCKDCKVNTYASKEYYMVNDSVWASAGMKPDNGMLCIKDLEKRLHRKLTSRDFFMCPLNITNLTRGSVVLRRRMRAEDYKTLGVIS